VVLDAFEVEGVGGGEVAVVFLVCVLAALGDPSAVTSKV
jgi:hypothetical protein